MENNKPTILYVDDESINLLLFEEMFSTYYHILTAENTEIGSQIIAQNNIKVVVSDFVMPHENGLDFILRIRQQYPDIIYIILTALMDVRNVLDAINSGSVFQYLLKPYNKDDILITIDNALMAYDLRLENKQLVNTLVRIEEDERSRFAVDLHDGIGPMLSSLKMYIEWMVKNHKTQEIDDILCNSLQLVNESIAQVRAIAYNISPHILEKFGFITTLQSYIENIKRVSTIHFTFNTNTNFRLSSNMEVSIFRVLKECITNTQKHSQANEASINIEKINETLLINYCDNGKGFDFLTINQKSIGMGLQNIKNRIKSIGGDIQILTSPDNGFQVKMKFNI